MKLQYIGTIFRDEWVAIFSIDHEISNNGVNSLSTAEFKVSRPTLGINDSEKRELNQQEVARAEQMILDELKQSLR